ncbi:hypothetical protein DPMN_093801 [Dreissena polymorpha]|uniref:Uncharacterized protein n=1 Tax=Dreissena polymorpha TaxID=45954 RepID=A0A9D4L6F1_DREPO|nr:hypothetical protein DPMN_093801 [Dreissena polymorpha]
MTTNKPSPQAVGPSASKAQTSAELPKFAKIVYDTKKTESYVKAAHVAKHSLETASSFQMKMLLMIGGSWLAMGSLMALNWEGEHGFKKCFQFGSSSHSSHH